MGYVQSLQSSHFARSRNLNLSTESGWLCNGDQSNQVFYGVNQNDSQVPMTTNYSLTVTQYFPRTFPSPWVCGKSQRLPA